eukprot:SAG11_NODE_13966_length_631_cov_0.898496_2_plen_27_part_01
MQKSTVAQRYLNRICDLDASFFGYVHC